MGSEKQHSAAYLTLDQAAERAQVSRHTLMGWIRKEGCPVLYFGERLKRVPVAEFDAWMGKHKRITGSLKDAVREVEAFVESVKAYK